MMEKPRRRQHCVIGIVLLLSCFVQNQGIAEDNVITKLKQRFLKGSEVSRSGRPKSQKTAPSGRVKATGSRVTAQEALQVVEYHNQKRAEVGSLEVTWSAEIAEYAQERADTIARTGQFTHLPQGENPYGENLAQGGSTGGAAPGYSVLSACDDWYAEKQKMPKGARIMTIDLFNRGVGHYTQMIWKESTEIGVGIATFSQNGFQMTVVVCCYNPRGNFISGAIY